MATALNGKNKTERFYVFKDFYYIEIFIQTENIQIEPHKTSVDGITVFQQQIERMFPADKHQPFQSFKKSFRNKNIPYNYIFVILTDG